MNNYTLNMHCEKCQKLFFVDCHIYFVNNTFKPQTSTQSPLETGAFIYLFIYLLANTKICSTFNKVGSRGSSCCIHVQNVSAALQN